MYLHGFDSRKGLHGPAALPGAWFLARREWGRAEPNEWARADR